jgi:predicted nucleic acid-binding protein
MANQNITVEWWEQNSNRYELFISELVYAEASQGHQDAAARRLEILDALQELEVIDAVRDLAVALMREGPLPLTAEMDAYHIAVAAVHGMDYLLTWNCKHIANAALRPKLEIVCRFHGYEPPVICTPQELMED